MNVTSSDDCVQAQVLYLLYTFTIPFFQWIVFILIVSQGVL